MYCWEWNKSLYGWWWIFICIFNNKKSNIPYSVIGSDQYINLPDGSKVFGRKYAWGSVSVEDETVSDFSKLRNSY